MNCNFPRKMSQCLCFGVHTVRLCMAKTELSSVKYLRFMCFCSINAKKKKKPTENLHNDQAKNLS